jgi:RIO kinase 1
VLDAHAMDEDEGDQVGDPSFDHFLAEGLISEVLRPIKSGKEASVHLCGSNPARTGADLVALKVYHPREKRNFRNDARYREGRVILNARDRRAVAKKTDFGRRFDHSYWIECEWEAMGTLHAAGCDVPRPIARGPGSILMEYLGDEEDAAPGLRSVGFDRREGTHVLARVLWNVEVALRANVVHGDLSPFNVLMWEGRPTIIDFPQAVDPRFNGHAFELLLRDVGNVCRYFARFGVVADPDALAADLWTRWTFATL